MKKIKENFDSTPPKIAIWFLKWFCTYHLFEEIEGDLLERFEKRKNNQAKIINQLLFFFGVLGFFRPMFWRKNLFYNHFWGIEMFRSNLKFAVRNLYKNFFFSAINISGLALGIACVLFIFFYIQYELSYDSYNEKKDYIYRVVVEGNVSGNELNSGSTPWCAAPTMKREFPEVKSYTRFLKHGMKLVKSGQKTFKEYNILVADSNFFDFFSIDILVGNSKEILKLPNTVAISKKTATKYFGSSNPIGETIIFSNKDTLSISGVFDDIPSNTHFKADFLISKATFNYNENNNWSTLNCYSFLLLEENASQAVLQSKMPILLDKYIWPEAVKHGINVKEFKANGFKWDFILQPLLDIHTNTYYRTDLVSLTDIKYIYIFSIIAMFILVIASINFINLSTAKSASRAKEVGIKKVVGSFRSDLIAQFLTESVMLTIIAFIIAIGLVQVFKQFFFDAIGKSFPISYFDNWGFICAIILVIFFTGVLAGSFPAFVLSKFNPTTILRGSLRNVMSKGKFRSSLVVFQFTASLIMLIGTFVIYNQLSFMRSKDLGFDKDQVLIVNDLYILGNNANVFKDRMLENSNIINGTLSGFLPVISYRSMQGFFRNRDINDNKMRPTQKWDIDENYFETLGISIIKGRNFSKDLATDRQKIIINKACADYFEFENPLESKLGRSSNDKLEVYDIIGVVENFHFTSLKQDIEPIIFFMNPHNGSAAFKIRNNVTRVVDYAETLWNELAPGQPFSYKFMDEAFDRVYKSETDMLNLFQYFSVIAILIGSLGLFALSAYTVERRTKEIGLRKIMGARISSLLYQLTKEFTILVIISLFIASPIAYILMEQWLVDYANRIELGFGVFLLSGLVVLLIALATVFWQAYKAAIQNPINSLKYE